MGGINQALAANKILRINDFDLLGFVQSFDWAPELQAQEITELGNFDKLDTSYELRTSGSMEFASIGNTAGILARMLPNRNASDAFLGYQFNSGGAGGKNAYTFTEADLIETRFDLIQHERPDSRLFTRSLWLPRCQLASISGSARADGFASESMTFSGSDVVGFNTPYQDIRAIPATVASATTLQLADTTILGATWTLAFVYVNDRRYRNGGSGDVTTFALAGSGGLLTMTTSVGATIAADADCMALLYKTTPSTTFPSISGAQRGTTATYVRGSQVNIYIAPVTPGTPLDTEKFLKVQSVDYSIGMGLQDLMQLERNDAGSSTYCRVPTLPLSLSVNATVYETDWQDWKQILNKSFSGSVYNNTYEFSPSAIKTQFAIVIEYWTKANPAAKLQVWGFLDMAPTGRGTRVATRGRGEVTWNFTGTKFQLQGFNV
jgi:hypothetical protein